MGLYSIKEMEHLSGVKAHTLRIWEQRYKIVQPKRTDTNIRYYTDTDLKHLLNIAILNKHGYRIGSIAKMRATEIAQTVYSLNDPGLKTELQTNALMAAMIELDEAKFEKVMSTNVLHYGFEQTMLQIVYPFLEKIGIMWMTNNINPAQEHFISNLIRQKIIVAIDGQVPKITATTKKFLLFLPEKETHEISLLFLTYVLKVRNHKVIYLGANVPLKDVVSVTRQTNPDYLFTLMTCVPPKNVLKNHIENLANAVPTRKIFIAGHQVKYLNFALPINVHTFTHNSEIIPFLDTCI